MTAQALEQRELAVVIGLEVHVQLETATKIFCSCSTEPAEDEEPNTRVCPVCLGLPGALPVLNEAAVESAVKIGKALNADIAEDTRFHRKNYYYPDLPKNFQITQYDAPICADGTLEVSVEGTRRDIGITRAHLEEDPGEQQSGAQAREPAPRIDTADYTLVNYNRAGTPLVEIVTEPDFRSPQETRAFLAKLEEVLEYLGVFDATRDGRSASTRTSRWSTPTRSTTTATSTSRLEVANRTEVKNISSHKGAEKALAYEVTPAKNAIQRGRAVEQETRHWDESRGITVSMRSKEEEKDYRYFREADLPPLEVATGKTRCRFRNSPTPAASGSSRSTAREEAASKLTSTKQVADFFEDVADRFDADLAATWVADNLLGELNYRDMQITDVDDRLDEFTQLVELVAEDEITAKNAHETVLREMLDTGDDPDTVVDREGLGKTADDDAIGVSSKRQSTRTPAPSRTTTTARAAR